MEGRLQQAGDQWTLSFTRAVAHPPEKVWRALTEPEHLRAWFPCDIVGEREAGASLEFVFRNDEGPPITGEMLVFDRPSLLEFRWGDERLRFELEPTANGTALTFVNTFGELGKAARDAAGWHACLDALAHVLDGSTPPWTPESRWSEVHHLYVDRFPPEAATIGPPPGRG